MGRPLQVVFRARQRRTPRAQAQGVKMTGGPDTHALSPARAAHCCGTFGQAVRTILNSLPTSGLWFQRPTVRADARRGQIVTVGPSTSSERMIRTLRPD